MIFHTISRFGFTIKHRIINKERILRNPENSASRYSRISPKHHQQIHWNKHIISQSSLNRSGNNCKKTPAISQLIQNFYDGSEFLPINFDKAVVTMKLNRAVSFPMRRPRFFYSFSLLRISQKGRGSIPAALQATSKMIA